MKKRISVVMIGAMVTAMILTACQSKPATGAEAETQAVTSEEETTAEQTTTEEKEQTTETATTTLENGVYSADFNTDSNMFHVNESLNGKGTLTVADGKMSIHISLTSQNILNLYEGTAEDAQKDGAVLLQPTTDSVTYSDGITEDVNGFDVTVPALDQEFDLALIGTKGKWYDHKVSVSNPTLDTAISDMEETTEEENITSTAAAVDMQNGQYTVDVTLEGGSGKAKVESPANVTIKDGEITATIVWSSSNYDYMLVDGTKYLNENTDANGGSTFTIPVKAFDEKLDVIGDTTAMSTPHEVEYTLYFDSSSLK